MKKKICLILAALMILSMTGCAKKEQAETQENPVAEEIAGDLVSILKRMLSVQISMSFKMR